MNKKGYFALYLLIIVLFVASLVITIGLLTDTKTSLFSHSFSAKKRDLSLSNSVQRLENIIKGNISFQKESNFSDLQTSFSVEEVRKTTGTIVFSLISSSTKEKVYEFPVYAADDLSFSLSNLPADASISITNTTGFSQTFTTSSFSLPKKTFYDDTVDPFSTRFGKYTIKITTTTGDLSLLSINPVTYTKQRTIWIKVQDKEKKHTLYKQVTIDNTLNGQNTIKEEVL